MKHRIAIVGTGTEIGKTHVACALARVLALRKLSVAGLKPVESGIGEGETDAARLGLAAATEVQAPLYGFADPVSPHLAARRTGAVIELGRIVEWLKRFPADWQLVETAGGLLSPLGVGITNLDLTRSTAPTRIVLVAPDRLGVLHDLTASLRVLQLEMPNVPVGVALSAPQVADASTGTNADEIRLLGIHAEAVPFPRAEVTAPETLDAAERLLTIESALPDR